MQLKNKKFHITTLGCRVNLFESNWIASKLESSGAIQVFTINDADICLINTCTVTNTADAKCKNFLRRIKKNPNLKLSIAMGCFSQMNPFFLKEMDFDIILGNKYKSDIVKIIREFDSKKIFKIENLLMEKKFDQFPVDSKFQKTRAYLKIQDGCNYMCSYCIIPFSRGKQRFLEKEKVFSSIKNFLQHGYKEIVLTGVNTAGYGEKTNYTFCSLLADINKLPGDFRVRISSVEPFQLTPSILDIILDNPNRWCQHFHICIQSTSPKILRDMNRKYSLKKFIELCDHIKSKNSLASITTDYIVGYPTETNALWRESLENLAKIPFSDMHIFPYSSRNGTASSRLKSLVTSQEKTKRLAQLKQINIKNQKEYLNGFIGKHVNVLFENPVDPKTQNGHSEYFFQVFVKTDTPLVNTLKKVKITKVIGTRVFGSL